MTLTLSGGLCSRALYYAGQPTPRSCARCGLGPCPMGAMGYTPPPVPAADHELRRWALEQAVPLAYAADSAPKLDEVLELAAAFERWVTR